MLVVLMELLRRQRDAVGLGFFNENVEFLSQSKSSQSHHRQLYVELEKGLSTYNSKQKTVTSTSDALHEIANWYTSGAWWSFSLIYLMIRIG